MRFPALSVVRKTGFESIVSDGQPIARLADFWAWAHSDITSNAERGKFGEYLVALAMGCSDGASQEWGTYDVLAPEGIKIEVKTSAYLQTWAQDNPSRLEFSIKPSLSFDYQTNELGHESKRQADVYVFCVENCLDQDLLDPLILSQWDFYPVATAVLDDSLGDQKSVSLPGLLRLGARRSEFHGLREAVLKEAFSVRQDRSDIGKASATGSADPELSF